MDAGKLDQPITVEARTVTKNSFNEDVETWAEHSTPKARVVETPGREFLKGGIEAEGKAVFQIRYRAGLNTADHRVDWRGRKYGIEDITGSQRERFLWLHCKSVTGAN